MSTASLAPVGWSDWNGKLAADNVDAFNAAASNITVIGLSFGGGCFFANGVGTADGSGTFDLDSFTLS
jgi:esterase/lipase